MADRRPAGRWAHAVRRGLNVLRLQRARILTYHSISDCRTDRWSIAPQQFEHHMRLLRASQSRVVSLDELAGQIQRGLGLARMVAITFDDGYCDFLEHALPILRDNGLPATVFVPVAALGRVSCWSRLAPDAPIMDSTQVEQVLRQGFAIGSHSLTHRRLPTLSEAETLDEIDGSRQWLQESLGLDSIAFAYPFGDFGRREVQMVQAAGYRCAVGFGGLWGNGPETSLFELNREPIARSCDDRAFQLQLRGYRDWALAARSLLRFQDHAK